MSAAAAMTPVPRVVLDTNVCLDLFVFRSARSAVLRELLDAGRLQAVTRDDCRAEWQRVLRYPVLALDAAKQQQFDAVYDRVVLDRQHIEARVERVPRCRDPDDQKFLDLARDAGATALITRDAELLVLAGRTRRAGLFDIVVPADIAQVCSLRTALAID